LIYGAALVGTPTRTLMSSWGKD